jgi:hypothetical protein
VANAANGAGGGGDGGAGQKPPTDTRGPAERGGKQSRGGPKPPPAFGGAPVTPVANAAYGGGGGGGGGGAGAGEVAAGPGRSFRQTRGGRRIMVGNNREVPPSRLPLLEERLPPFLSLSLLSSSVFLFLSSRLGNSSSCSRWPKRRPRMERL